MSITKYLNDIFNGNLDAVKSQNNKLLNTVGRLNPKGYDLIPLFAAIGLLTEKPNEGKKMLEYLLSLDTINVSKVVIHDNGNNWTNEINTIFHLISSTDIPIDICKLILEHRSVDISVINTIDHDDYTPLDLAYEYNPNIVKLLESKGAKRNWRVGPGLKPKDNNNSD